MKTSPDILEMGITEMLAVVLSDQLAEGPGPNGKLSEKMHQRGVVTSPVARSLFTAGVIVSEHIRKLAESHACMHKANPNPDPEVCKKFESCAESLLRRRKILVRLMWQAVGEEHPVTFANSITLFEGWVFASKDGGWNDKVAIADPGSVTNSLIRRLAHAVSGEATTSGGKDLSPVEDGEEVLGVLEDERIKAVRGIIVPLLDEAKGLVPEDLIGGGPEKLLQKSLNDLVAMMSVARRVDCVKTLVSDTFWCGVRDSVPGAAEPSQIGLREGWKIVKCPPDEEEGDKVRMVDTPLGPALLIRA